MEELYTVSKNSSHTAEAYRYLSPTDSQALWDFSLGLQRREAESEEEL